MGSLRYTGLSNFLARMGKREGWTSYWRGNSVNMWKIIGNSILRYKTYELIKKTVVGETNPITENETKTDSENTDKSEEVQE